MDCAKSLALLSDFHDGSLNETEIEQVRLHLVDCPPCDGVFRDLTLIVIIAAELRDESALPFPQQTIIWQRLTASRG